MLNMCLCVCQEQMKQKAEEVTYEALTSSVAQTLCEVPARAALKLFDHSDREENPVSCNRVFFYRKMPGRAKCPVNDLYLSKHLHISWKINFKPPLSQVSQ